MTPTSLILVVEDDAGICRLIQRLLTREGYSVLTAPDGQTALAAVAARRPDLVISDVALPTLDGLSLVRSLRQDAPLLPVIVMSGNGETPLRLALDPLLGNVPFLAKPFALTTLLALVHDLLPPWGSTRPPAMRSGDASSPLTPSGRRGSRTPSGGNLPMVLCQRCLGAAPPPFLAPRLRATGVAGRCLAAVRG